MSRLNREALQGRIQTVTGLIDPAGLGPTLMHEHLIWDIRPLRMKFGDQGPEITLCNCWRVNYGRVKIPQNLVMDDVELMTAAVREMVEAGGRSIVELSSGGLRPDPAGLAQIAQQSGAQIIMGCGHYVEEYQDDGNRGRTAEDFAAEMIEQVFAGAWGSGVRAGIIGEIGCQSPWTAQERRVMQGAILAQRETGAALNVHPGRDADSPQEIMAFVSDNGGIPERTILSHIDRTIFDSDRLFRLADTGCIIEFDLFGQENTYYPWAPDVDMPNDAVRLKFMRALIDRGHLSQLVISHDICYKSRLTQFGGHGFAHIFANVIPLMRERGFSQTEITTIMELTPRSLLTFQ